MAKGYTVGIASETKAFKQGVDAGIIEPLEDAEKALTDLGKSKGPQQLERELEQAQKASKKLETETEKTASAIEQEYRGAYRKMKNSADDAYDKASEGAQDFKQEASQSAREGAASFSGEFDDVGDFIQETLANALGGFGPAGAAAGIAAAVGLGVVLNEIEKQKEAADELKSKMAEMYQAAVEEGRTYLSASQVLREVQDIMWNPDRVDEYNDAQEDAKLLGLDISEVLAANAGDKAALEDVQRRVNALIEDEKNAAQKVTAEMAAQGQIASDLYTPLEQAADKYADIGAMLDENSAKAKDYQRIEEQLGTVAADRIQRTRDADQARWEAHARSIEKAKADLQSIPTDVTVKLNVDDTAVRNYRPPNLSQEVFFHPRNGKPIP